MKFGIFPFQLTAQPKFVIEHTVLAEELGFESAWIAEHHGLSHMFPDALSILAAAAVRTTRIRLGTQTVLPLRHPLDLAERGAIVDALSDGRLILGAGQGYAPEEFAWFGIPEDSRLARFKESIELIRRLWSEERVTYQGEIFQVTDARVEPRPVQSPPPIWLLAWAEPAVRRAAKVGDGWLPGPSAGLSDIKEKVAIYRDALGEDVQIPLCRFVFVADSEEQAVEHGGKPFYRFFQDTYLRWPHPVVGRSLTRESTYEEVARDRFILGTPDSVADQIRNWNQEVGISELVCYMHQIGSDEADVRRSMELFASDVAPQFA